VYNFSIDSNFGNNRENLKITFTDDFMGENSAPMMNYTVWGHPYEDKDQHDAVKYSGTWLANIMWFTLIAFLAFKAILGESCPLLWGMLNSIQIIYFFPLLMMYYPPHLV
jgi:hypothetical protein